MPGVTTESSLPFRGVSVTCRTNPTVATIIYGRNFTRERGIMADEQKRKSGVGGIGDGIRAGIGILSSFKDAVEETLQEAVDRGDLSPERARRAMRDTVQRVQGTMDEAREKFEFISRKEHDELQAEVAALRGRIEMLESGPRGEDQADGASGPAAV
jgi:polyhydroxyalkanoate synthesis regulator phasin